MKAIAHHKLDFLIALYIFCIAVAELMGAKTFPIAAIGTFALNASIGIFVVPLMFTITDVVTEVEGKQRSRQIVYAGLFVIFLIFLFSLLATHLPPSARSAPHENAFDEIFGKSARIAISSLIAFGVAQLADVHIFHRVRSRFGEGKLWLRNNLSNILSQGLDTTVFISLAFYATAKPLNENMLFLAGLIIPYWLLKCCVSALETPFVYLGARWLRKV